jgi:glycosyltransferase involved in cell wall biosynthesis
VTRVVVAGTFAADYSRNRIVLGLLRDLDFDVEVIRFDLWGDERYALLAKRKGPLVRRAVGVYLRLAWRLLRTPRPRLFVVLYPGHLDVRLVSLIGRLRRVPTLYDHFISLEETAIGDRRLRAEGSLAARLLRRVDRGACRAARLVLADTPADAAYFAARAGLDDTRVRVLWVGAQDEFVPSDAAPEPGLVFFHGTYIPLHGIDTIVRAAKLLEGDGIRFRLLGSGQERPAIERLMRSLRVANVELADPVPVAELPGEIARGELCLGVFGTTQKTLRVVPNKVFEYLAVGRPVLTADTPGIRSAFSDELALVEPGDPEKLGAAVRRLLADPAELARLAAAGRARFERDYSRQALARLLARHLSELGLHGASAARDEAGAARRL